MEQILADAGIQTVLTGVPIPRMNSVMERWVQVSFWTAVCSGTNAAYGTLRASTNTSTTSTEHTKP
ncbi:hypothetical protein ACIBHX_51300 [Nonomuraea sp. NPDC050536]|uniref:hypothetical protein n=1 Tax=Nonomuraea sp. NPDC050536 TaxID=3364366 RepID=UPI0037CB7911